MEPLHWSTTVITSFEGVVVVVQVSAVFAAPRHASTVTTELPTPVSRLRVFSTVTVHLSPSPPTLSIPLHWAIAIAADALDAPVRPPASNTNAASTMDNKIARRLGSDCPASG